MKKNTLYILYFLLSIILFTSTIEAENADDKEILASSNKNIITTTYYDCYFNIVYNIDEEVSNEYLEEYINSRNSISSKLEMVNNNVGNICMVGWPVYYETNAKRINLDYFRYTSNTTYTYINSYVSWKTVPYIKQYDVIAVRWDGNATVVTASGKQTNWTSSTNSQVTNYSYLGSNMNAQYNGVGISMNLYDTGYNHALEILVKIQPSSVTTVYASYQHAITNNITLSESKSYNFSSSGLGGVINFTSSTIANKYDGMNGVSYSGLNIYNP